MIYLIIAIILIVLLFNIFISVKQPFWSKQPVFHFYSINKLFLSKGVIDEKLPKPNKFLNQKNIKTFDINNITEAQSNKFLDLIQNNYLKNKSIHYNPTKNNIFPYFIDSKYKSFISIYNKPSFIIENNIIKDKNEVIGAITSRPITIKLNDVIFYSYYVDFLCVDKKYRKQNIAPQLIQTHSYELRHKNCEILTFFFKRESELTMIVPFVVFNTYAFDISNLNIKNNKLHPNIKVIKINNKNLNLYINLIDLYLIKKNYFVNCSYETILNLIESNNYFIYISMLNNNILSCICFKNSCVNYNNKKTIECFCVFNNTDIDSLNNIFNSIITTFLPDIDILLIDDNSNANLIISNFKKLRPISFSSPNAYYFYNYCTKTIPKTEFFTLV